MIDQATMETMATFEGMDEASVVIPLSQALPPVAMLLAGVPVLTGLVLAAVRYVAGGSL